MSRSERHARVLALLRTHRVESQDQLQSLLEAQGHKVTQATLSRDLRALGVARQPQPDGGVRYQRVNKVSDHAVALGNLRAFLRAVTPAGNLLVLRTRVGGAQPVALALDNLEHAGKLRGIVGTVAGDDTVLAVVADGAQPATVEASLWALLDKSP